MIFDLKVYHIFGVFFRDDPVFTLLLPHSHRKKYYAEIMHCIVFLLELQKMNGSNEKVYNFTLFKKIL